MLRVNNFYLLINYHFLIITIYSLILIISKWYNAEMLQCWQRLYRKKSYGKKARKAISTFNLVPSVTASKVRRMFSR